MPDEIPDPLRLRIYPNRRLYNREAGGYITYGDVAHLIKTEPRGVVIIDNVTKKDVTHKTLLKMVANHPRALEVLTQADLTALVLRLAS